ncbi:hypothetical protein HWV62_31676 [Athelia sp. TMB]|nr:hypothetical protein HWV62_31676 [Athelia sp. TMB]
MIRFNEATECCITKGAEAHVVGWDAGVESHGMPVLETLFVELKNPPAPVQIEGLPINVVPIARRQEDIVCTLTNGEKLALTTSDGTIIVQGFDKQHIQGGASGFLRQEFRELELLDEITKQMFEGTLPKDFGGGTRNVLIKRFRELNGEVYMPPSVHKSIAWSAASPFRMTSSPQGAHWQFSVKSKHTAKPKVSRKDHVATAYVPALGTVPVTMTVAAERKRKAVRSGDPAVTKKKQRTCDEGGSVQKTSPVGFVWDSDNWSCCYDSLMTVLMSIWIVNPKVWTTSFRKLGPGMRLLSDNFRKVKNDEIEVETARDRLRMMVNASDPESFPYGEAGGRIHILADVLGKAHNAMQLEVTYCRACGKENITEVPARVSIDCPDNSQTSTQAFLDYHMLHRSIASCANCSADCFEEIRLKEAADLLLFNIGDVDLRIDKIVRVRGKAKARLLDIRGIIYSDGKHYTARIFDTNNDMWFHDGMIDGRTCVHEGDVRMMKDAELCNRDGAKAVLVVYAKRNRG